MSRTHLQSVSADYVVEVSGLLITNQIAFSERSSPSLSGSSDLQQVRSLLDHLKAIVTSTQIDQNLTK